MKNFCLFIFLIIPFFLSGNTDEPCNDLTFPSNQIYYRGSGTGSHQNERLARRMARLDAQANLASNISIGIESVIRSYFVEKQNDDKHELFHITEEIIVNHVDKQLSKVKVKCIENDYSEGNYTYFMIVEMRKTDLIEELNLSIAEFEGDDENKEALMDYIKKEFEKKQKE